MKMWILAAGMMGLGLMGCTTDPASNKDKLEFGTTASTLTVGETSALWSASRTIVDANGRTNTNNNYGFFHLESSDTNVASVVLAKQLVGRKAGTAVITGHDDNSDLVTETSVTVTVTDKP